MIDRLNTDKDQGLDKEEVSKRLKEYGANELKREEEISPLDILIDQFKNIIVLLLIIAAGLAFVLGDIVEMLAILAVIILNAGLGFVTEYKAERSVEALKEMITTKAKVVREGQLSKVNADSLVPGDILIIEEGDRITADGRLLEADNLEVNEAVLTGESEPAAKEVEKLAKEVPVAERNNMVFMGAAVTRGNGVAVVTGTGTKTEMGKISNLLKETEEENTPLEERLDQLGKSLISLTLIIAFIVAAIGVLTGRPILEMLETAVALAIAAVPEGLPAVATITLAIGMRKMAEYNALVKRLPAVETLGSTTVICTDKTGTITENQMTLQEIYLGEKEIEVTGSGYEPTGEFKYNGESINPAENNDLSLFLQTGVLCNNAVTKEENNGWKVVGDPTEGALVTAAKKAGFDRRKLEQEGYNRLKEIPFTSEEKYMAVSYQVPQKGQVVFVKGSPEVVINMCKRIKLKGKNKPLTEEKLQHLQEQNRRMAQKGLRVLGVAYRPAKRAETEEEVQQVIDTGLTFLGLAGIMDPPRADVKGAVTEARNAGIRTIMITGDQPDTAQAIAGKVGIEGEKKAVTGTELTDISLEELAGKIKDYSVFARVSPEDKLNIVDALNKENHITAMTGDGVNDAPALKKADIGVAMGQRGTAVTQEAADMILLDDNFTTIEKAVKQGRVIFDNIEKFIYYLFSCNLSEIIFIFLGILLQVPIPLLALQILWLNLVTDVFPALVLAWEIPEEGVMDRPPRDPEKEILTAEFKKKIGIHGIILALGPLVIYLYLLNLETPLVLSRTAGFTALAFTQLLHVFDARRKTGWGFDRTVFKNLYLWGAVFLTIILQLLVVYVPFLQRILSTASLTLSLWRIVIIGSLIPIIIIQCLNLLIRKLK